MSETSLDAGAAGAPESPYKNLWVPLVLVPAAIVVGIVLVFVFFGAIGGSEKDPGENLELMLTGGANERSQAAWSLVLQLQENWEALAAGEEPSWPMDATFRERLSRAWDETGPSDHAERFLLASLSAQLREPEGVPRLLSLLAATGSESGVAGDGAAESRSFRETLSELFGGEGDAGGLRLQILYELGLLAPGLDPAVRAEVTAAVVPLLGDPDHGLAHMAAMALQNLPGEASAAALRTLLSSPELELRGQAAVSLSHLGDPAGAAVLRELVDPAAFELDRAADPARWKRGDSVSHARARAVSALGRLALAEDRPLLARLSEEEPDLAVRQAAMRALTAPGEAP